MFDGDGVIVFPMTLVTPRIFQIALRPPSTASFAP
jgi:hypothetical protein